MSKTEIKIEDYPSSRTIANDRYEISLYRRDGYDRAFESAHLEEPAHNANVSWVAQWRIEFHDLEDLDNMIALLQRARESWVDGPSDGYVKSSAVQG